MADLSEIWGAKDSKDPELQMSEDGVVLNLSEMLESPDIEHHANTRFSQDLRLAMLSLNDHIQDLIRIDARKAGGHVFYDKLEEKNVRRMLGIDDSVFQAICKLDFGFIDTLDSIEQRYLIKLNEKIRACDPRELFEKAREGKIIWSVSYEPK